MALQKNDNLLHETSSWLRVLAAAVKNSDYRPPLPRTSPFRELAQAPLTEQRQLIKTILTSLRELQLEAAVLMRRFGVFGEPESTLDIARSLQPTPVSARTVERWIKTAARYLGEQVLRQRVITAPGAGSKSWPGISVIRKRCLDENYSRRLANAVGSARKQVRPLPAKSRGVELTLGEALDLMHADLFEDVRPTRPGPAWRKRRLRKLAWRALVLVDPDLETWPAGSHVAPRRPTANRVEDARLLLLPSKAAQAVAQALQEVDPEQCVQRLWTATVEAYAEHGALAGEAIFNLLQWHIRATFPSAFELIEPRLHAVHLELLLVLGDVGAITFIEEFGRAQWRPGWAGIVARGEVIRPIARHGLVSQSAAIAQVLYESIPQLAEEEDPLLRAWNLHGVWRSLAVVNGSSPRTAKLALRQLDLARKVIAPFDDPLREADLDTEAAYVSLRNASARDRDDSMKLRDIARVRLDKAQRNLKRAAEITLPRRFDRVDRDHPPTRRPMLEGMTLFAETLQLWLDATEPGSGVDDSLRYRSLALASRAARNPRFRWITDAVDEVTRLLLPDLDPLASSMGRALPLCGLGLGRRTS